MATPIPFHKRVAAELRSEMAIQQKSMTELIEVLGLVDRKAAKLRYDGAKPMTLAEVDALAAWLEVDLERLLLGRVAVAA